YFVKGKIKSSEVLEKQSPLKMMLLEPNHARLDSVAYSFTVSKQGEQYKIRDEENGAREYTLGSRLETPMGPISLVPQESNTIWEGDLQISYMPAGIMVDVLRGMVQVAPNKEAQSFLVNFSM